MSYWDTITNQGKPNAGGTPIAPATPVPAPIIPAKGFWDSVAPTASPAPVKSTPAPTSFWEAPPSKPAIDYKTADYPTLASEYQNKKTDYDTRIADFQTRLDSFNKEIDASKDTGVSPDDYDRLSKTQLALQKESKDLGSLENDLNSIVEPLNSKAKDAALEHYKATGGTVISQAHPGDSISKEEYGKKIESSLPWYTKAIDSVADFLHVGKAPINSTPLSSQNAQAKLPFSNRLITINGPLGTKGELVNQAAGLIQWPERLVNDIPAMVNVIKTGGASTGAQSPKPGVANVGNFLDDTKQLYDSFVGNGWSKTGAAIASGIMGAGVGAMEILPAIGEFKSVLGKISARSAPAIERLAVWEGLGRPKTLKEAQTIKNGLLVDLGNQSNGLSTKAATETAAKINRMYDILKENGIPGVGSKALSAANDLNNLLGTDVSKLNDFRTRQTPFVSPAGALPGYKPTNPTRFKAGLSAEAVERVGGAQEAPKPEVPGVYSGEKDLTTKVLQRLEGRSTVSPQFISDLTNASDLKQPERDLIRTVLDSYPKGSTIPVKEFADKVKSELLPLKRSDFGNKNGLEPRYENIALPAEQRGNIANYSEHTYQSPIKTSAGDVHFGGRDLDNYFAHTRIEDIATGDIRKVVDGKTVAGTKDAAGNFVAETGDTRRIIELQSDLFQKGRLTESVGEDWDPKILKESYESALKEKFPGKKREDLTPGQRETLTKESQAVATREMLVRHGAGLEKLEPYRNTWQDRIIREEVKQAAKDGKSTLLFPTGETAMKIEGLGQRIDNPWRSSDTDRILKIEDLKVGKEINDIASFDADTQPPIPGEDSFTGGHWIITDVLGDGKFKAVPNHSVFPNETGYLSKDLGYKEAPNKKGYVYKEADTESFDISGKVDTNNPIYKFYEKEVARYLKNNYSAALYKDAQGVTWFKVNLNPKMAEAPIQAFKRGPASVPNTSLDQAKSEINKLFNPGEIDFLFPSSIEGGAQGRYTASQALKNPLIEIVQSGGKINDKTLYHEAFHAYINQFLSPEARARLIASIKNSVLTLPQRDALAKKYEGSDVIAEEYAADAFASWLSGKKVPFGTQSIFSKIKAKLQEWINKLLGLNKTFEKIVNKERPATPSPKQPVERFKVENNSEPFKGDYSPAEKTKASSLNLTGEVDKAIAENKAVIIDPDNIKVLAGGDYTPNSGRMYSHLAELQYDHALSKVKNPLVKIVVGGPGSGKTEMVTGDLAENFDGIIYDAPNAVAGALDRRIAKAMEAGKTPVVHLIISDPLDARAFSLQREIVTGRPAPEDYHVKTHMAVPEIARHLIKSGVELHIKDTRDLDLKNALNAKWIDALENPQAALDLVNSVKYDKNTLTQQVHELKLTPKQIESAQGAKRTREAEVQRRPQSAGKAQLQEGTGSSQVQEKGLKVPTGPLAQSDVIFTQNREDRLAVEKGIKELRKVESRAELEARLKIKLPRPLEDMALELSLRKEAIDQNPMRNLVKFMARRGAFKGKLPEVTGKVGAGKFGQFGDHYISEATGINDSEEARAAFDKYIGQRRKFEKDMAIFVHEKNAFLKDARGVRDEIISERKIGRMADRQERHINEILGDEATRKARIERLKTKENETQQKLKDLEASKSRYTKLVEDAHLNEAQKKSLFTKFKTYLSPIKQQDAITQKIYMDWETSKIAAKEDANKLYEKYAGHPQNEIPDIIDYEAGANTPWVRDLFDELFTQAKRADLNVYYKDNYIPHVYQEKPQEITDAIAQYMKDKSVDKEVIDQYKKDGEIPEKIALKLKIRPTFTRIRSFPDYKTAMKYGLTPRFRTIAEHAAFYKEELDKTIANKKLVADLIKEGKVLDAHDAPESWVEVKLPGRSFRSYYASPDLAKSLNGQFRDEENLTGMQTIWKYGAKISQTMQEIHLSAGLPGTTINFFAIGQAIKSLTVGAGEAAKLNFSGAATSVRAANAFLRANFNKASLKFFKDNEKYLNMMGDQNINISSRIGDYARNRKTWKEIMTPETAAELWTGAKRAGEEIKNVRSLSGASKALTGIFDSRLIGVPKDVFDKMFNEKTFTSMMPQMQVQVFKDIYEAAIKDGIDTAAAEKFAGETVKNEFGLIDDLGRTKDTKETLNSIFFAPKFREGLINIFTKAIKGFSTEFKNPAFARSRSFIIGLIISYAAYNYLNYKLNGNNMWDNEPGHEFDLKVPLPGGKIVYTPLGPSVLSFVRNMASAAINFATGHNDVALQKAGTTLSMPLQLGTQIITNQDYFGRPIYDVTDSPYEKAKKAIGYMGLSVTHPYFSEWLKYYQGKQDIYQTLSQASELPLKFSTEEKAAMSRYYDGKDKQTEANARERAKITGAVDIYDQVQKLKAAGDLTQAESIVNGLSDKDYQQYQMVMKYDQIAALKKAGKDAQAKAAGDALTNDEYLQYQAIKTIRTSEKRAATTQKEIQSKTKPEFYNGQQLSTKSFIEAIATYANAIGSDPATAFDRIMSGQRIRRVDNGAIIVERMGLDASQKVKTDQGGNNPSMKLDHTIPLELGGSNSIDNLKLVPTEVWTSYTPVENHLGKLLRAGKITKAEAQSAIAKFKQGDIKAEEILKL